MFEKRIYDEGQFQPERVYAGQDWWNAWCRKGVLAILSSQPPAGSVGEGLLITLANTSYVAARPGDDLWSRITGLAAAYDVEIFPVDGMEYVPWDASDARVQSFDALRVRPRPAQPAEAASVGA